MLLGLGICPVQVRVIGRLGRAVAGVLRGTHEMAWSNVGVLVLDAGGVSTGGYVASSYYGRIYAPSSSPPVRPF